MTTLQIQLPASSTETWAHATFLVPNGYAVVSVTD